MKSRQIKAFVLLLCLWLNATFAFGQTVRGVGVKVKNANGATREVKLYEGSYALIIGMSGYTNGWDVLNGVKTDVAEVEKVLGRSGFTVETAQDLKGDELQARIEKFIRDYGYETGNRLIIYFAGHGYTQKLADGRDLGYVIPVDAPLPEKDSLGFRRTAVSMDKIEAYARQIEAKHALFVFDSCFSGKLISRSNVAPPPAINDFVTYPVRQFVTSGAANQEVPDDSVFRKLFVRGVDGEADLTRDGYITGTELAVFLKDNVTNFTKGSQTPQYGKIRDVDLSKGDFVFVVPKAGNIGGNSPTDTPEADVVGKDRAAIEREAWSFIQSSGDATDFREFLKEFPAGANAGKARIKLEQAVWDSIKDTKDKGKIQAYLTEFPAGANLFLAKTRMRQIEAANSTATPASGNNSSGTARAAGAKSVSKLPNNVEMSFAYIPAGEFQMGSNTSEDEKPIHTVKISQGFWIGQTEVTQGQWKAVMNGLPSKCDYGKLEGDFLGDLKPIICVSWDDAQEFLRQLNAKNDGYKYRLPTEAEWEYAARAGTTGDYAGNLDSMAWYSANSNKSTQPVGTKQSNSWNLYDMHGNVWSGHRIGTEVIRAVR